MSNIMKNDPKIIGSVIAIAVVSVSCSLTEPPTPKLPSLGLGSKGAVTYIVIVIKELQIFMVNCID